MKNNVQRESKKGETRLLSIYSPDIGRFKKNLSPIHFVENLQ